MQPKPMNLPSKKSIVSPCVSICVIDAPSGLCLGCLRTLDEISSWPRLPADERLRILAALEDRRLGVDDDAGP